ncbi:heparan-alpha-glucosaminide N-acetyltransferase domain-containing protein [Pelomonas sp. SE-A7]|uniref:acyltransferase family protein n=1 Tax=Pelomonas sp. SE-A7 TaxID=3054953 RepID=UPI00259C6D2F|nr:heparan-alpha-glucosaminide N-acetyltransferase domain-containing protein [Pelomonas sp. SE-A7]MDM4768170.1 heparan-alpha-glucosaminide N-acetyltransferase domain-containing protein [Pelomonas sp. SE-A7]
MSNRLASLDAFRGFTIAAMLLVNNPGDWGNLYGPLAHAKWHGWTFTDWIFPFFVFISGISMTLSLGRRAALGDSKQALLVQALRRGATIVLIGLLLNLIPQFDFANLRWPGVLQRLGLCTMLAAPLVLWLDWRRQLLAALALLVSYSLLLLCVAVPDAAGVVHVGSLNPGEDTGAWLDRLLMDGHLWKQARTWDPEGLLSTLPAVASLIAGALAGHWLASRREPAHKAMGFMVGGLACLWLGQLGDAWLMPINKSLWTPPYVFAMAGWACLVFGSFYWLLDAQPSQLWRERAARWGRPLIVFGMNALFLFAFSGLVAKLMGFFKPGGRSLKAWAYEPIQALGLAPVNASLLYAIAFVAVMYGVAHFMWSKKWFVKV